MYKAELILDAILIVIGGVCGILYFTVGGTVYAVIALICLFLIVGVLLCTHLDDISDIFN